MASQEEHREQGGQGQDNTAKTLLLFVLGILLVGFVVFMVRDSQNQKNALENSLTNSLENNATPENQEVASSPMATTTPKPIEDFGLQDTSKNLESEVQGMSDQKLVDQRMSVEQKLAVKAPSQIIDATKNYTATLKTSMGDIVLALDAKNRPQTVNNFVYLAKLGFYNDVIFHRVIASFMLQGGDPLGTGTGGPTYKFADELSTPNSNTKGTIAMANSGPNTNGSQFFINLVDNNYLDAKHSVFGKVTSGMDVVEAIGKIQTGANDRPVTPVAIRSIEVAEE